LHFQAINESISHGKELPIILPWQNPLRLQSSAISHIYFSVMNALCAGFLVKYIVERGKRTGQRFVALFGLIFLLTTLHVFTGRTGLFGGYAGMLLAAICWGVKYRRYRLIGLGLLAGAMAPIAAYHVSPTLKERVDLTVRDVENYLKGGDLTHWSIGRRLATIELAWEAIEDRPLVGYGPSAVDDVLRQEFEEARPELRIHPDFILKSPHNQFLHTWIAFGMIGLAMLLVIVAAPMLGGAGSPYAWFMWTLLTAAFVVESMMQRQIGVALTGIILSFMLIPNNRRGWAGSK
jgi:O-antigen ligase